MAKNAADASAATYSYLGPPGTFTEAALAQVPEAEKVRRVEALRQVVAGGEVQPNVGEA
jgi:prephenate dehydratase